MGEDTAVMEQEFDVIGRSVPKIDAREKATGRAKYTGDLKFPGMLIGKILGSPYAHARIVNVDTSRAEALPGVKAVITGKDVPDVYYGLHPARYDEHVLCRDKARFVGDKVAAVAAVDEETATRALDLIEVEYEVLPPVLDPLHAMDEGQPQIHPRCKRNINAEIHHHFGDVDKAFKEAYHIRTDVFRGQRCNHAAMEPHSAVSLWDGSKLTVYSSTQSPHQAQYGLHRVFGLKMGDVRVLKTYVGGGFGGKLEPGPAEFVSAALAIKTGRPVKVVLDRYNVFTHNRGRHACYMKLTTGVTKEGKILGVWADFIVDGGAYTGLGIVSAYYMGSLLPLLYEFDNYKFDCYRVHTNLPSCGPQRGHGAPQPRYAMESQMDLIAKDLNIDPIELRLRNARRPNTMTLNDLKINSCGFTEAVLKAREISGWDEKKGKLPSGKGIGIGCGSFLSGPGSPLYPSRLPHAGAVIKVSEQGDIATLYIGAVDIGQGSDTVLAQMAAEALGINYEDIRVVASDTQNTPLDFGAYASRQTLYSGAAVKQAGEEVKRQVLELAADMLEANVEDLSIRKRVISVKGSPDKTLDFAQVANEFFIRKGPLVGRGSYTPPKMGGTHKGAVIGTSPAYSFAAQISEVDVDEETGQVAVTRVYDVHDCGTVINPTLLHAQVHGALFMGMGEAMYEEVVFDKEGRPLNANLGEYRIPTALDVPNVVNDLVSTWEPAAPWGVKEVGEGATVPTMGCYANAIYDAIGIRVYDMPINPEKVWRAIQERKRREAEAKG